MKYVHRIFTVTISLYVVYKLIFRSSFKLIILSYDTASINNDVYLAQCKQIICID